MDTTLHSHIRDERHDHSDFAERASNVRRVKPAQAIKSVEFGSGWYHDAAIDQARRDAVEARCNPYG